MIPHIISEAQAGWRFRSQHGQDPGYIVWLLRQIIVNAAEESLGHLGQVISMRHTTEIMQEQLITTFISALSSSSLRSTSSSYRTSSSRRSSSGRSLLHSHSSPNPPIGLGTRNTSPSHQTPVLLPRTTQFISLPTQAPHLNPPHTQPHRKGHGTTSALLPPSLSRLRSLLFPPPPPPLLLLLANRDLRPPFRWDG